MCSVLVKIPSDAEGIVGDGAMSDVNCQRSMALASVMAAVSFADRRQVRPLYTA